MTRRLFGIVSALLLCLGACSRPRPAGPVEPLVDGAHRPDVLTEARLLEPPPATSGNRFVRGWWPWEKRRQPLAQVPLAPGGRLEGVNLGDLERALVLESIAAESELPVEVRVRLAGRPAGETHAIGPRSQIPLPADLPLGRFPIDFEVDEDAPFGIVRAGFTRALPAGEVAFEGADVVQSGSSLVDFVRPAAPGSVLVGAFEPPEGAADGQSFRLLVEAQDEPPREVYSWRAGSWLPWRRGGTVRAPLPASGGWMRIRLLARGEGPPARWRGLGIAIPGGTGEETDPPPAVEIPAPPRLVVFYVMDALRADHVGHLGGAAELTPTLDRLAAEGAAFTRHLSLAPNTVPAMKTLFTGQVYLLGGGWKLPADGPPTVAQRFLMRGYRTALLTGNGNVSAWRGLTRGFQHAPPSLHYDRVARWSDSSYNDNAERVHAATLRWLDGLAPASRAFVHLQTIHPHNPYDPPRPFVEHFAAGIDSTIDGSTRTLLDVKRQKIELGENDRRRLRALYAASVAYNDAELARFLEALDERYAPGEVMIVVSSDHGEELFEHGGVLHGYTLYDEQLHVPLVVWWPGVVAPRRIDAATDHLDLHATLALLAGEGDGLEDLGQGLWPHLLTGSGRSREVQFAAASSLEGGMFMARSPRYKLVWAPRTAGEYGIGQGLGRNRDAEQVFDLAADPGETRNLAGEDLLEVAWLRERLKAWIEVGMQLETGVDPGEMDEQTRRSLKALGYVN